MVISKGIRLKKKYGQHFLRDINIVGSVVSNVELDDSSSVFEIGCGDGFLTRTILETDIARLWVFEIDSDWVKYINETINDQRLTVFEENFLDVDFSRFESYKPWTLLANLPYQVTFPILHKLQKNRAVLKEGVIMVQEEVAQKIVKTSGRGYGYPSLFFQHFFEWKLLDKVPPEAFFPPPKVYSRLLYFKPKKELCPIPDEERFWKFIKACFSQPRRTLRNSLMPFQFDMNKIPDELLKMRAQQMDMSGLLKVWELVR